MATLSDEEVIFEERQGNYITFNIKLRRVKTFGNCNDASIYFLGILPFVLILMTNVLPIWRKKAIVPIWKSDSIVEDEYVDIEFDTGCLRKLLTRYEW
jgi:hypothetical protein